MSIVLHRGMQSLYFMTIAMTTSPCPYCKNSICAEWSVSQIWSASQIWSHVCIYISENRPLVQKTVNYIPGYAAMLRCCAKNKFAIAHTQYTAPEKMCIM